MYFLALAAVLAAMEAANIYDVIMTEKGLKAGVAVEGNTWLVGSKPSATALYLRDSLVNLLATAPSLVSLVLGSTPAAYGFLICPAISGIKHVLGGLAWNKLLKK